MNAKQVYLKDENNNVVSAVTSVDTIYDNSEQSIGGGNYTYWYTSTLCR